MDLKFQKISAFERGTLFRLLEDAYSFDGRWQAYCEKDWVDFDDFFYDHLQIAEKCGFITTLDDHPIGHISWDPGMLPAYVRMGHNCIASRYQGNGYGKLQLQEAIYRIRQYSGVRKITVTTSSTLVSAQHNYERVGFQLVQRKENNGDLAFSGDDMDYEMIF